MYCRNIANLEPPSDLAPAFFLFFLAFFLFVLDGFDLDSKASFTVLGGFSEVSETSLGYSESSKNVKRHCYHFYFEY